MKIWQIGLIYLLAIAVCYLYKKEIWDWMLNGHPSVTVSFLLTLCAALFPVLPFKIVLGMLGFMYGPLQGALIGWAAASLASLIICQLVRTTFQKQGRAYLARFEKMRKLRNMMETRPFQAILIARLIPFFPQVLVNIYPAFLSIRFRTYATATLLGKIPGILLYCYLGNQLFTNFHNALIVIVVYMGIAALCYFLYRKLNIV